MCMRGIVATLAAIAIVTRGDSVQRGLGMLPRNVARNEMVALKLYPIFWRSATVESAVLANAAMFQECVEPTAHKLWV